MSTISSGREPKNKRTAIPTEKKRRKRLSAADITAVVCAVLCAGCLIFWSVSPSDGVIAVSLSDDAPMAEEKGFWDRFSEAIASAFGYGG